MKERSRRVRGGDVDGRRVQSDEISGWRAGTKKHRQPSFGTPRSNAALLTPGF